MLEWSGQDARRLLSWRGGLKTALHRGFQQKTSISQNHGVQSWPFGEVGHSWARKGLGCVTSSSDFSLQVMKNQQNCQSREGI